jgi:hypothetical protein
MATVSRVFFIEHQQQQELNNDLPMEKLVLEEARPPYSSLSSVSSTVVAVAARDWLPKATAIGSPEEKLEAVTLLLQLSGVSSRWW